MTTQRDHGGDIDAAIRRYGGTRAGWLDLSTGINPVPYPLPQLPDDAWNALPDTGAFAGLTDLARQFWNVPAKAAVLPANGTSAIIAALPRVLEVGKVCIPTPTYNEHAAAFRTAGWTISETVHDAMVVVHPNNPDGKIWSTAKLSGRITIIDESFCDVIADQSLIHLAERPNTIILKSFGKFWGLAGLRLGFAIGDPALIARLSDLLGPWQVSGPALTIGAAALADPDWADATRARLAADSDRLDQLVTTKGAEVIGGTTLFRLYRVDNAPAWQDRLAQGHVWSRIFPYADDWLRLGLPAPDRWNQLEAAL